ncbi:glycoside hydrolase family 127 protein [Microbacteriaceae bacterium VKM Ac-2855]|nr:glycoside hydrolase family 127 protein [Microbacteriaceae bacterium VKM Ac-2855]
MTLKHRAIAVGTVFALAAGLVSLTAPPASAAGTLSIESAKRLDLQFEGNLTDAATTPNTVTVQKGSAAYGTGITGQAFNFTGGTALRLGTAAALQPQNLTASFWYKPNATMTGEQVFTWNKTVYNSDGWYLTSEGDTTPLALSIGPSSGQPYKVAVDATRSAFFPTGQWTHVAVTYDKTTKQVQFYRNGVRQISTVKSAATGTATGVLGSEASSVKTIGYNGPTYNGAHLNGLLDDYTLYNGVASIADVVTLTQRGTPAFNPATVAQGDLDGLSVPASASSDFGLPLEGAHGTTVVWTSSNPAVIAVSGGDATVTKPTGNPVDVTLTATASYGGSTPVTRAFTVTVAPEGVETSVYLLGSELEDVTVTDPYFANGSEQTVEYLLSLDPEKFLYSWYIQAGLNPTTASGYGGWERSTGTRFQGHFFGHYLSALSQAYATETDATTKAALLAKLTAGVDGLKRVQDAYALAHPADAGYVAPFSTNLLPSGGDGLLVPFYNLHKVLAGLLDAHEYAPGAVSTKALSVADGFGTWLNNWAGRQSNPGAILNTEYGGMNEALYELYSITEKPAHKRAAEYFDETVLFQKLAAGQDVLNGLHANTTIPKLIGALKRYTVFTDNPELYATLTASEKSNLGMYRTAAENFWQIVVSDHTYANGANSQSEHFHGADELYEWATNGVTSGYGENSTAEGCNEYNMLKLTRALFQVTKDVKYPDYYETTLLNTIVASQNPETGMVTYFQPQTAGYAKVFGKELDEFWCDHGTGIESFTKLGDSIYFRDTDSIYVNQFRSSELRSSEFDLTLTQTADVPNTDTVHFTVGGEGSTTLRLRIPSWVDGSPSLSVNGVARDVAASTDAGYVVVEVAAGDELDYTLPATVTAVADTENPNWVAFQYGPVLLATELSRTNVDASYVAGVLVRMGVADKSLSNNVVVSDAAAWKSGIEQNLVRIPNGANGNGDETMRFRLQNVDSAAAALTFEPYYSLYGARYATYMTLIQPDSPEAQAQIKTQKEQKRTSEMSIDALTSFDNNNSEADKNYKYNKSGVGIFNGQGFRDGQIATDAYFQYDMIVDPTLPKNYLAARYYGGDNGRTFGIYLNDVLLKNERVTNAAGSTSFYIQYDEIPRAVLDGIAAKDSYKRDQSGAYVLDAQGKKIPVVTVRFQGNGTSYVGGLFGLSTTRTNAYGTAAELSKLAFDTGVLSPALTAGVRDYTLTVPASATSVVFDADPAVGSGLVYVGDVLIDDTLPRSIPLAAGASTITLKSYAQDHSTNVTYRVNVVRDRVLDVVATASSRCVAGKVVLTVVATNRDTVPVNLAVTSAWGSSSFTAVAPGKNASAAFTTRAASITAGEATVRATATVDGRAVTTTVTAPYTARSC